MRWTLVLLCLLALPIAMRSARAQDATGRVTGVVSEAETGQPIPGANVVLVGTRQGTVANDAGRFTIAGVAAGRYGIRVTRIGYAAATDSVSVVAGQLATIDVRMRRVAVTLDAVVAVGYGTQRRADITGATASVIPNTERTPTTSLEQALQGTAAGVQVTQASAAPGGGLSIRIRGGATLLGNNEPLYIVDGFPIENDPANSSPTNGGRDNTAPANPLAALNPNDIASIDILKDASSTAIYGSRGANGVVIITTKRGSAGKPKVTLDAYTGMQSVAKRYDLLDAHEFALFANEYATAAGQTLPYANVDTIGAGTDWQRLVFRSAPMSNLQLGVNGGTSGDNATRYAISGGVFQQKGVVIGSDFNRLSLRGNIDQTVGARLRLGSSLLVSRVNSAQVPTDGSFNGGAGAVGAALQYLPILPVYRADGGYTLQGADFPVALSSIGLSGAGIPNPVASGVEVDDRLGDTRVLANASGDIDLLKGLTARSTLGADLSGRTRDTYFPRSTLQGLGNGGRAIRGRVDNTSFLNENTLAYKTTIGDASDVQAVAGYSRQHFNSTRSSISNTGFVGDLTGYENVGAGSLPVVGSGRSAWSMVSYFGRVNYSLLDRYLLTATSRYDGSSRFAPGNQWGLFPSGSIGWRVSNEPFMKRYTAISELKLRASLGIVGNPSIPPYSSQTRLSAQQYSFGGNVAAAYGPTQLGNQALSWENTRERDFGLDLGLWRGRLDFTTDYYFKRTSGLLQAIDIPADVGFTSVSTNAGSVLNKGYEAALTLHAIDGDRRSGSFGWTTSINIARNHNLVLDLGGVSRIFASTINSDIGSAGSVVQVGQPIGAFFGYKTDGIFRDTAEVNAYLKTTHLSTGSISPGQIRIVDVNKDGVIDANDRTIIGDPTPKFTMGWSNEFTYRGFGLSSLFDGTFGNKVLNLNLYRTEGASPSTNISRERFEQRWTPTNIDAKYPRVNSTPGALGSDFTDRVLESGSFFRLRTVTLSHDVPAAWLGSARGFGARAYVTGQNLVTFTNYSGFNPDVSSLGVGNLNRGVDVGAYPLARTLTFGLNLSY